MMLLAEETNAGKDRPESKVKSVGTEPSKDADTRPEAPSKSSTTLCQFPSEIPLPKTYERISPDSGRLRERESSETAIWMASCPFVTSRTVPLWPLVRNVASTVGEDKFEDWIRL